MSIGASAVRRVKVGDYAYVRPRVRLGYAPLMPITLECEHRGTITAVRPGAHAPEDTLVEVTFDDVPVTVQRVQEFYVDELARVTRLVPELRPAATPARKADAIP